jgi:methyl-accepting chemotaxis protein
MNPSLRELQIILADRVRVLSKQLDDVSDADQAKKIVDEMQEFNHRVTLVGGLLFHQQSQSLDQKVEAIRQGKGAVDRAIKNIADLANMLQAVSDYLALVDEVIDLAKAL